MNYRHAYHAGNFADVIKHAVLCRVLVYLREKPAPFRVIDTHAGAGLYDLEAAEASKTEEWRNGIGRLFNAKLGENVRLLLAPYLDAVAAVNQPDRLKKYPGSPLLARALMRWQDRLIACETEPATGAALARNLRGDARAKALDLDGWTALLAFVPPKERRGVVLIDPPYEQPDDLSRMVQGLQDAHRKWPAGIYVLWYPIKDLTETTTFTRQLVRSGIAKILQVELDVAPAAEVAKMRGAGLIVVNPPWMLHDELAQLLPELASLLSPGGRGRTKLAWLARETVK